MTIDGTEDNISKFPDPTREYDYFAFGSPERISTLKTMIEEREKKLFELELNLMQLVGNPQTLGLLSHEDFLALIDQQRQTVEKDGRKFVNTQTCPCLACQIAITEDSVLGLKYGLGKMRDMYKRLV